MLTGLAELRRESEWGVIFKREDKLGTQRTATTIELILISLYF